DSAHSEENMLNEYRWAEKNLRSGGVLVSDDINWNAAWNLFFKNNDSFKIIIETVSTGVSIKLDNSNISESN
ncbi:MAG: hypothetical protein QXU18_09400, partial [Thermoplasmatales archaeon]